MLLPCDTSPFLYTVGAVWDGGFRWEKSGWSFLFPSKERKCWVREEKGWFILGWRHTWLKLEIYCTLTTTWVLLNVALRNLKTGFNICKTQDQYCITTDLQKTFFPTVPWLICPRFVCIEKPLFLVKLDSIVFFIVRLPEARPHWRMFYLSCT